MLARISRTGSTQSLSRHSRNVSALCRALAPPGLANIAALIGLLHDMGKAQRDFQDYLRWACDHPGQQRTHCNHAGAGGHYAYARWYATGSAMQKLTAQIIALCICGHHAGLHDCIRQDGSSPLLAFLEDEGARQDPDTEERFFSEVAGQAELEEGFSLACRDMAALPRELLKPSFFRGLLTRLLLSVLVDADRWDAACCDYGVNPLAAEPEADWAELYQRLEDFTRTRFTGTDRLSLLRRDISDACAKAADGPAGVYTLTVPTGGGKTLSSLRYALRHAAGNGQRRIFYIIPFNTILDQNARDIREALGDYPSLLEHHSNVVREGSEEDSRRLTERWNSHIILTSMVHFLNALYEGSNTDVRRMHDLTNAVLIFDEIQALPRHCRRLFEQAILFLTGFFRCTAVLCTATQPRLDLPSKEIMADVDALCRDLKRVRYLPRLLPMLDCNAAAEALARLTVERRSALMIVNTKRAAQEIYRSTKTALVGAGLHPLTAEAGLSDEEIIQRADETADDTILCVHLSTLMYPAHRMELLRWVRLWTRQGRRVLCVSTSLIEAGINVSFPVVVRSLAGLPSIIQAAGRCNRNCEAEWGQVYLWRLTPDTERLPAALQEIRDGQIITGELLENCQPDALDGRETLNRYFQKADQCNKKYFSYPWQGHNTDLVEMLSSNQNWQEAARTHRSRPWPKLVLHQGFRTAGEVFQVIDSRTHTVVVPRGKGGALVAELEQAESMQERLKTLRRLQSYSVNLYDNVFQRLCREGGVYRSEAGDVLVLREHYYSQQAGVLTQPEEMGLMLFWKQLFFYALPARMRC